MDPGRIDMSILGRRRLTIDILSGSPFCMKRRLSVSNPRGIDSQHFAVRVKRQSPMSIPGVGWGRRSTIDMERINSQHFTVHVNCQLPIIDPGGGAEDCAASLSPCEARCCN